MKLNRDMAVAGLVAGCAFAASAQHIYSVAYAAGNPPFIAAIHAVGIDGLIYVGIRATQDGKRTAGFSAIVYGAVISLTFNAASYKHVALPWWMIGATMPIAMLLAFAVVHGGHKPADGQAEESRTRVDIGVRVQHESHSVQAPPVQAVTVQAPPVVQRPAVVIPEPARVVQPSRPAITSSTRRPRVAWDVERATELINSGAGSDMEIARIVIGDHAGEADRKRVQRLRKTLAEGAR